VRLLASRPTPNQKDQGIPLHQLLPLDLSGLGGPTSSYATAGIALRVSGALKPHYHDKVEIASVGPDTFQGVKSAGGPVIVVAKLLPPNLC
jgi:hypothetical protein